MQAYWMSQQTSSYLGCKGKLEANIGDVSSRHGLLELYGVQSG